MLAGQRAAVVGQPARRCGRGSRGTARPRRRSRSRSGRARSRRRSGRRARPRARARRAARRSRAARRPSCSGGTAASSQPEYAGLPRLRAASPAPSSRIRHSAAASAGSVTRRTPSRPGRRPRPRPAASASVAGDLHEQPARAARQLGYAATTAAHQVDDPRVEAFARDQPSTVADSASRPGTASAASAIDRIAQHHQVPRLVGHQRHGRLADQRQGPLRADQEPVQAAPLGQQVLERVAAHLPGEPAEVVRTCPRWPSTSSGSARGRGGPPGTTRVQRRSDVVGGAAVAQRPRAAGVVADHPADRAAGVGGRVRPEPQAVRRRRPLQRRVHDAGLHGRGPRLGVDRERSGSGAATVSTTMPGPTALPAIDVPAPRIVTGTPVSRATSRIASSSSRCRGRTTTCGTTR